MIVKLRLCDLSNVGALTLPGNENGFRSAGIDSANGFAYFGTTVSSGLIVKIRLTAMSLSVSMSQLPRAISRQ